MKTLIDHYAHDYRHMNLGEEDIRAMLTAYTREYEESMDGVGGMEITEGMRMFVTAVFSVVAVIAGFIIGLVIGIWV